MEDPACSTGNEISIHRMLGSGALARPTGYGLIQISGSQPDFRSVTLL